MIYERKGRVEFLRALFATLNNPAFGAEEFLLLRSINIPHLQILTA